MKNHPDAHLVRLIERYAMLDIVLSEDIKEIKSVIDKWSGENNLIFCGAGKNTLVFSAGEIVIKIGNKENFSIPYHPRILMPYFRKQYNQGLTIEVCDSVKVEEDAEITDKELLEKTGGIIQGMSGSPIVQNGKIIGAVTHVFVNDPTRGYGVYIDWMVDN